MEPIKKTERICNHHSRNACRLEAADLDSSDTNADQGSVYSITGDAGKSNYQLSRSLTASEASVDLHGRAKGCRHVFLSNGLVRQLVVSYKLMEQCSSCDDEVITTSSAMLPSRKQPEHMSMFNKERGFENLGDATEETLLALAANTLTVSVGALSLLGLLSVTSSVLPYA